MPSDQFTIRSVVIGLIAVLIILSTGMLYLATTQTAIPDSVDRLAFLVAGAVAGMLARTSSSSEPQDVQGVDEAVPTTATKPVAKASR